MNGTVSAWFAGQKSLAAGLLSRFVTLRESYETIPRLPPNLAHGLAGALQVGSLVRGRDHRAQARFALRHRRKAHGRSENASLEEQPRKLKRLGGLADEDRRNGRLAVAR